MNEGARTVVITGGGSGIGKAIADRLIQEGMRVAVLDLSGSAAEAAAGPAGLGIEMDVTDPEQVRVAIDSVVAKFGRVDVLVNNAGITGSPAATSCHQTPIDEWDAVQAVNVRGPFLCARAVIPSMLAQRRGHVITIASVASSVVFPNRCAYTASKGAALMLAKSIAIDYAGTGIRSNAVCPGFVYTPMTAWRLDQPELRSAAEEKIPIGRVAMPEEIADAVAVLAADRLAYMTGAALTLDGGWTAL